MAPAAGYREAVPIRTILLLAVAALLTPTLTPRPAQAATYAQIEGSGSTWSQTILQQWIADVDAQGMKVTYNGVGASQGRKEFGQNVTDFGMTEVPYQGIDEFGAVDSAGDRERTYIPLVGGALAFTYQLRVGDRLITDLDLSGETIAKIFTNQITNWDDPAITRDNGGHALPSLPITPVVRTDGSGTSAVFTTWLDKTYPALWQPYLGRSGHTSYFPKHSDSLMVGASGSDQVMNTVRGRSGNGAIGYVEQSYPLNARQPVAAVGTLAGRYVSPGTRTTWAALRHATVEADGSVDLDSVLESSDPDAYPLAYVSHAIVPTSSNDRRMTTAKRQTLANFMFYGLCEGQRMAGPFGHAPLPLNLVQSGLAQIAELKTADPAVDLTGHNISACQNSTFDPTTLTDIPPEFPALTIGKPVISGLPKVGRTLTASVPSPRNDVSHSYAWRADDRFIPGATNATYSPLVTDVNKLLSVTVTPHQHGFLGVPATSDHTQAVVASTEVTKPVVTKPVVTKPAAIKKLTLKATKAPTRQKAGKARVVIALASGHTRLSGRTESILTLRLGNKTITRRSAVTITKGVATIKLPKLPKKGRWRVSIKIPKSKLVLASVKSKTVTVKVKK